MSTQSEFWNSEATRGWADNHARIDRAMAKLTEVLLGVAAPAPGERVIDIGCGSGTTVLALAQRVGAGGHVLGVDFAAASVARAQARIAEAGLAQAEVALGDASTYAFPPEDADLLFSRFGVMFFPDPVAAFANLRRGLKPGGRVAMAVFRTPAENPFATAPMAAIRHLVPPQPPSGPDDPGQFAWADPARVHRILGGAGFSDVTLTPHDTSFVLGTTGDFGAAADYTMSLGPVMRATLGMEAADRQRVHDALLGFFQANGTDLPGAVWLIQARKG